jgi:hypothetical protein|tara:strand:- start:242 stop:388 length:147 start_codon:yes stop_codon:yes gene_type:complete
MQGLFLSCVRRDDALIHITEVPVDCFAMQVAASQMQMHFVELKNASPN